MVDFSSRIKMEREKKRRKCTIVEKMLKSTINPYS